MGKVWYASSFYGEWHDILLGNNAKNPAIDYLNDKIIVVYEYWDGSLKLKYIEKDYGNIIYQTEFNISNDYNDFGKVLPVVGIVSASKQSIMIYKKSSSSAIQYRLKTHNPHNNSYYWSDEKILPCTDANSSNPTVSSDKISVFHIAYQQDNSTIKYMHADPRTDSLRFCSFRDVSNGSGFEKNIKPSIIALDHANAQICWIGETGSREIERSVVFVDPSHPNRFRVYGRDVRSVNINRCNDRYTIAWAVSDNHIIHYTDSRDLRTVYSLGIKGKDIQLSNGTTPTTMYALAFNTSSPPFYMQTKRLYPDNGGIVPIAIDEARKGIAGVEDAKAYFELGNVVVNNEKIDFVEIPDTASINSQQMANKYLITKPFNLNDNSDFFYSVKYGLTDSLSALNMLSGNKNLTFKVELLEAVTNEVLDVFDEVTYDQGNIIPYEKIDYQVLTNGIGERLVKLRLVISSNFTPNYSVAEKHDEPTGLAKKNYKQISFRGSLTVKEYALEQNYPNPFNPRTLISWQSPVGSHQTLKIYDVLGNEVATLVNEYREAGKHKIEFDASALASGVYIYKLTAGQFTASRKMMVLK